MKKITYVYGFGRERKIEDATNYSSDFLYGYDYFLSKNYQVKFISASINGNIILKIIEKVLRRLTKLPFYLSNYINWKNIKIIFSSDILVLTNDTIALSLLPLLKIHQIFKKGKILIIVMGLFAKPKPNKGIKFIQIYLIKRILNVSYKLIFLGKKEKELAVEQFPKYENKLSYIPFSIDTKFWKKTQANIKYDIIFVGNDGNRDYKFLIQLIKKLNDLRFLIISSNNILNEHFSENKYDSVDYVKGSLSNLEISDLELRDLYSSSSISIVPLNDTIQPSGQSVSLQSLSLGIPVVISSTNGNWFHGEEINKKYLNLTQNNNLAEWEENIRKILLDKDFYINNNDIENFMEERFDNIIFNKKLDSIIFYKQG